MNYETAVSSYFIETKLKYNTHLLFQILYTILLLNVEPGNLIFTENSSDDMDRRSENSYTIMQIGQQNQENTCALLGN